MKQIIERFYDGRVYMKYYINDKGQYHGLAMNYWGDGNVYYKGNLNNGTVFTKTNHLNGQMYGLETYVSRNGKITLVNYIL